MARRARTAGALVAVGVVLVVLVSWLNRPAAWRPVLLVDVAEVVSQPAELQPGFDFEVVLELADTNPRPLVRELTARGEQALVDGRWRVLCDDATLAAGESRDYLSILTRRSALGKLRRVATRAPLAQDESSFRTFGMRGDFLVSRVVGAFRVPESSSGDCALEWQVVNAGAPARLALRRSEADWRRHDRRYAALAVVGELMIVAGLILALVNVMQRRRVRVSSSPAAR